MYKNMYILDRCGWSRRHGSVDLLVDPGPEATYFDFAQFELDMEALFQREVDVVSRRALDPEADREILADAVAV